MARHMEGVMGTVPRSPDVSEAIHFVDLFLNRDGGILLLLLFPIPEMRRVEASPDGRGKRSDARPALAGGIPTISPDARS